MTKAFKIKTKDIVTAAIYLAFILVFVLVPFPHVIVDMASIALIAVCLASTVNGFGMGLFTGASFGVASLVKAVLRPSITTPIFLNPAVSILPRILIPITTYFTFKLMKRLLRRSPEQIGTGVAATAATVVGVCTNTFFVLGTWALFYFGKTFTFDGSSITITWAFFAGILATNFVIELIVCTVVCPVICTALRIALGVDKRGRRSVAPMAPQETPLPEPEKETPASEEKEGGIDELAFRAAEREAEEDPLRK